MTPDHRIAVCPGSYDPITNGHLDVITRASELFDVDERLSFIREATQHLDSVRAEAFSTLVVDFARAHGSKVIVKGLRAISDFEYEFEMHQLNRLQGSDVDTLYLMASPQYSFLSSSGIKELAMFGGAIDGLVPTRVAARLKEELSR